jgi:hypothetical protein
VAYLLPELLCLHVTVLYTTVNAGDDKLAEVLFANGADPNIEV